MKTPKPINKNNAPTEKELNLKFKRNLFLKANRFSQLTKNKTHAQELWNKYFLEYIKTVG